MSVTSNPVVRVSRVFKSFVLPLFMGTLREANRQRVISRWTKTHALQLKRFNPNPKLLARLCGFLAGDGSVQVRKEKTGKIHHSLEFFPDDESLIPPFAHALIKLYGVEAKTEQHARHFRLRLYSKVVVCDLLRVAKFGLLEWSVPNGLLHDDDTRQEWLRAYFDSEAYVSGSYVRVQSVNRSGIYGVRKLLAHFGIRANQYTYVPKKTGWNKVYILIITKKADRLTFLKKIGFNHKKKLARLLSSLDDTHADVA